MKKYIKLSLLFLIILLIMNSVCADGWHISDQQLHLYEPNQKAVISWDGTTETMILASAVKSNNIANFAWVVPIQSYSKPEVTAGNISIFEDLVDYFKKSSKKSGIMGTLSSDFSGVSILETKEIDVYDITILEATNSNDLINWLNNNGYKVPEEAKPILDKYVAKSNFYFVANKIDLTNKFSNVLSELEEDLQKYKKNLTEQKTDLQSRKELLSEQINQTCSDLDVFLEEVGVTDNDLKRATNTKLTPIEEDYRYREYAKTDCYKKLLQAEYYFNLLYIYTLPEYKERYQDNGILTIGDEQEYGALIFKGAVKEENVKAFYVIGIYDNEKDVHIYHMNLDMACVDRNTEKNEFLNKICSIAEEKSLSDIAQEKLFFVKELFASHESQFKKLRNIISNLEELKEKDGSVTSSLRVVNSGISSLSKNNVICYLKTKTGYEKYAGLCEVITDLQKGMSTPLKFEFQPIEPYYPLEISSLNLGVSIIEVYVLTNNPVSDKNDLLKVEESKMINSKLKKKLNKHLNLGDAKYVTRLSYKGNLKDLNTDAEFSYEKQYNLFQKVEDWVSNLFK